MSELPDWIAKLLDQRSQLIVDDIECTSGVHWRNEVHRDNAVQCVRAGLESLLTSVQQGQRNINTHKFPDCTAAKHVWACNCGPEKPITEES